MGCLQSLFGSSSASHAPRQEQVEQSEPGKYSWDTRPKIDPKDFTIENLKSETVGRMPGTINGMQFIIQNCEDCNIYIFDHTAQITVDDCTNCRVFMGPIKGSIFIRDCKDCKFMLTCQQFRTRDCHRIDIFLACVSQPIIESSTKMKFGCYQYHYPELEGQFKSAGMSIYNNNWSGIHDFTPVPEQNNFSLLPKDANILDFIPLPICEPLSDVQVSVEPELSVVPRTLGKQRKTSDESCLVVFFSDESSHDRAREFLKEITTNHSQCVLVQSKEIALQASDASRIFDSDNYSTAVHQGKVIGLELNGDGAVEACQASVVLVCQASPGVVFVSSTPQAAAQQVDNFYNYADMQMNA